MKKMLTFLLVLVTFLGLIVDNVHANGLIVSREPYPVYETGQRALMIYDDGIEDLILSVKFQGTAEEFGWIIPTPTQPEISKVDSSVFRRLSDFSEPKETLLQKLKDAPRYGLDDYSKVDMIDSTQRLQEETLEVEVLEEKTIGMYDYAILKAEKVEDLKKWMNDNEFVLPTQNKDIYPKEYMWDDTDLDTSRDEDAWSSALPIFQDYIDNGWYLVTVKINNSFVDSSGVEKQLSEGRVAPLRLRFKTTDIVFPMKLTAIAKQDVRVETYVVADKKVEIENYQHSNFTTYYAGSIKKEELDEITKQVGKGSWYETEKDFVVTKIVNNNLSYNDMTEELIFAEDDNQKGVNNGTMRVGEWMQVPLVILLSIPVFVLGGIFTIFDVDDAIFWGIDSIWFMIITSTLSLLSLVWVVLSRKVLRRTKQKFIRIIMYITQFFSLWLVSLELGILLAMPIGFLVYQMDLNEIFILNAFGLATLSMITLPVLYYRKLCEKR